MARARGSSSKTAWIRVRRLSELSEWAAGIEGFPRKTTGARALLGRLPRARRSPDDNSQSVSFELTHGRHANKAAGAIAVIAVAVTISDNVSFPEAGPAGSGHMRSPQVGR